MEIRGGDKFEKALQEIADQIGDGGRVKVGFLANATYEGGKSVAMIAAIQEFGAPGRGIPPRPFFRNMVAAKAREWPSAIAGLMRDNNYNVERVLEQAGQAITGQLRQSIVDTNEPPLAASTIRRKGHAKPLIDTGYMFNSVDYEVSTE